MSEKQANPFLKAVLEEEPGDLVLDSATGRVLLRYKGKLELFQGQEGKEGKQGPEAKALKPEAWKKISALGYQNGFEDYEAFRRPEYRKDPFGTVEMRGVTRNTKKENLTIVTLPVGYRPSSVVEVFCLALSNGGWPSYVIVKNNGEVVCEITGTPEYIFFDNVRFSTE